MYDVATQTVSKLSGELSSAFVEAAEANSNDDDTSGSASDIVETRIEYTGRDIERKNDMKDLETAASSYRGEQVRFYNLTVN